MTDQVVDPGLLDWRVSITDKQGRPSPQFQRAWNTSRNNQALIGFFTFGTGAPSSSNPNDGAEYIDITTNPYSFYVGQAGSWHLVTPLAADPTALAGATAVPGSASTYMRSDASPAIRKGSSTDFGIIKVDNATVLASSGIISVPIATLSTPGLVQPDGVSIDISDSVISVPTATTSSFGLVKPDGTTIAIAGGVISAVGGGGVGGVLPLVTGDLPGPVLIADSLGQCIGVPL